MRVNSMYTSVPKENVNPLTKKNVSFSGSKKDSSNNVKKNENGKNEENSNTISLLQNSKDDLIKNLQEQIERIKKDDTLDSKGKKIKIEGLQKQIDEIEQAENKKKLDEFAKAVMGDNEKLAKKRIAKAEKEAKAKGSDLEITQKGMSNLIKAEQKLDQAQELKGLKAQKEAEATMAKQEIEFDGDFQSAQLAVRKKEKMGLNASIGIANDFNGEFIADTGDKQNKLAKLSDIISNIDDAINSAVGKAGKEVEAAKAKADENADKTDETKEDVEEPKDDALDAVKAQSGNKYNLAL